MIVVEIPQPKSCWDCPLENGEEGYCQVTGTLVPLDLEERLSDCPIKAALPEHHSELVDKKEVYKKFYSRCLAEVATEVLSEVTIIIPATKEGDK